MLSLKKCCAGFTNPTAWLIIRYTPLGCAELMLLELLYFPSRHRDITCADALLCHVNRLL